jgi:hypothetical protein
MLILIPLHQLNAMSPLGISRQLEHFPAKWTPVRRKKMRPMQGI